MSLYESNVIILGYVCFDWFFICLENVKNNSQMLVFRRIERLLLLLSV